MIILSLLALTTIAYACDYVNSVCTSPCMEVSYNCVSANCFTFTSKLGSSTSTPFSGTVAFKDNSVDLIITITYVDPNFSDAALKGIVKGENSDSCLSLLLWRNIDNKYEQREQSAYVISYVDSGSTNKTYSFTIPSKDFITQLVMSDDGTTLGFTGYYSLEFNIGTNLQSVLQFSFSASIQTKTTQSINTSFSALSQYAALPCTGTCNIIVKSSVQFCPDEACTTPSDTANLYLNDQVWIKHAITTAGVDYYLVNPEIYYTGDKLLKKATLIQSKTNTKGYSLYLIKITIAWTPVSISVKGTLSSTAARFLSENERLLATSGTASANSAEIKCISVSSTDTSCITCSCPDVDNSSLTSTDDVSQANACPCSNGTIYLVYIALLLIFMN